MRVALVMNARAGGLLGAEPEPLAAKIVAPFQAQGEAVDVRIVAPDAVDATLAEVLRTPPDILLVGGGDGTQRAAGRLVRDTPVALGVIPLGTHNILAQMLGLPLDPVAAAEALATGTVQPMDAADVNGGLFLCNALMGLTVTYSSARAQLRGTHWTTRLPAYVRLAARLLAETSRLSLIVDDGVDRTRVRALTVAVSNNPYIDGEGVTPRRQSLDGGVLGVYVARHESGWHLVRGLLRVAFGRIADDPHLDARTAHRLVIAPRRRRIDVSVDGEIERLETPLVFRALPGALRVVVPRSGG